MSAHQASAATVELIELGDIDELVRFVDRLCDGQEWDEVEAVRALSRKALERGRQLWPVAARAEYRLALSAPGRWAASVLRPGAGRFTLGPLPEVAASSHAWDDLAPHLPHTPEAAAFAFERVVRGEDLTAGDARQHIDLSGFDLPLRLEPWEPDYPTAVYTAEKAEFPLPPVTGHQEIAIDGVGDGLAPADDHEAVDALTGLASGWTTGSNGRAEAVAAAGDISAALAQLGLTRARVARLEPADAIARMAWTAASGGAHGRRRGMAAGRFDAWWALAAIAGLLEAWPVDPAELGEVVHELEWWAWDTGAPHTGWSLRLAVHDPVDDLSWAVVCADERSI